MKRRLISVILFAVLAAAISSTLLYKVISASSPAPVKAATAPVFVASRDLNAGSLIGDKDVEEVTWPVSGASPWVGKKTDVIGRALLTPLAKGEPVSENRLAPKGAGAGLASRIPPGMRAVAVHVDELTGLSRFILPGMHVDVISTGNTGGPNGPGMVARTILQNVTVFSTNQVEAKDMVKSNAPPVFNLLVTPKQAEILSQAVAQTRIELVLRNPLDTAPVISEAAPESHPAPLPFKKIFKPAPVKQTAAVIPPPTKPLPPAPAAAPAPPPTVEIIQGTKRTVSPVATEPKP